MRIAILVLILITSQVAHAQSPKKGGGGGGANVQNLFSVSGMALTSSTVQGGQGPAGSSVLTQSEYVHSRGHFGLGLFFQYDMQGSSEKDSLYGPKFEMDFGIWFFELAYAVSAKRAFTDRNIAEQSGDATILGLGVRFSLAGKSGGARGPFFQAAYKLRTMTIKKQDGVDLDQAIEQKDGYPLVGIGYQF